MILHLFNFRLTVGKVSPPMATVLGHERLQPLLIIQLTSHVHLH